MSSQNGEFDPTVFTEAGNGELVIAYGDALGRVVLKLSQADRRYVLIEGEPDGRFLAACFEDGLATGRLARRGTLLVDLSRFTGLVDWDSIGAIRRMAEVPGERGAGRVAYVVRSTEFELLIKIARELLDANEHRLFDDPDAAPAWLDSSPTAG